MLNLFFSDLVSTITTVLILFMLFFITLGVVKRHKISKWGRLIFVFILVGTAISATSATRDAFMMDGAIFAPSALPSVICSVAGALIFLSGAVSIFVRNQKFRKGCFYFISLLFIMQVIAIEGSRIAMYFGAAS